MNDKIDFSDANVTLSEDQKVTPYIAVKREGHHRMVMERFKEPPSPPDNADAVRS